MKDMRFNGGNYTTPVIKIGSSYIVCYQTLRGLILNRSKNYRESYNIQAPIVA